MSDSKRLLIWLALFAIAMAQVEASLVVHFRTIYYPADPLHIFPLSLLSGRDLVIEIVRELATLVMIVSVAILATKGFIRRFAAFVYVFGLWDLFYYLWLKVMIGWPLSWLEWDVLYLIPWPWLGPWIAPALIALLFVAWGGWIICFTGEVHFERISVVVFVLGVLLALLAFLLPAIPLLEGGAEAFRGYQPGDFNWSLYFAGYVLMVIGLGQIIRNARAGTK